MKTTTTNETKEARFNRLLSAAEARTAAITGVPVGAAAAAHKAAGEAYARAYPTRVLTPEELAHREALAGSDDGWGDYCSPVRGDV
jgi:hypothetical protein